MLESIAKPTSFLVNKMQNDSTFMNDIGLDEDIHTNSRSLLMERDSLTPSPRFSNSSAATEKTSIRYKSTRGGEVKVTFRDAILKGLAEDGEF